MLDLHQIRKQFPILQEKVNAQPLVYLDNAATSQKPIRVIEAIKKYYEKYNANVHRGIHTLSQEATIAMEEARKKVQNFINAEKDNEVIFTKGTTESINEIAYAISNAHLIQKDDEIIISYLEHHSNIVPWQMLCERTGAKLKVIPIDKQGVLQLDFLEQNLSEKTKIVSFNYVSNALGIINPVRAMIKQIRKKSNAMVLVDAAQAIPHFKVDVQDLDCDFLVFSGHKMYAPTGTGILYGKENILEKLAPFHGGGEMIDTCSFEKTTYAGLPFKFEAGTPNIAGNIALGEAVDFMNEIGHTAIQEHENKLLEYTQNQLLALGGIEVYGEKANRTGVVSFNLENCGIASDTGMILDKMGIAVRTGHHCTQPIMRYFDIAGTVRASFAVYNTLEEIDIFIDGVKKAQRMLS
ncbi:MAG: cysteine desulfurase CsdA [Flavobacteriales bacterium]|nr:MAG: cysteine desulfurase CsdA [Flavobacteriales bacterium]